MEIEEKHIRKFDFLTHFYDTKWDKRLPHRLLVPYFLEPLTDAFIYQKSNDYLKKHIEKYYHLISRALDAGYPEAGPILDESEKIFKGIKDFLKEKTNIITSPARYFAYVIFNKFTFNFSSAFYYQQNVLLLRNGLEIIHLLNRYLQTRGQYPVSLQELQKHFATQVPVDVFTGKDCLYQRENGTFRLHSPGPDGNDDGFDKEKDSIIFPFE